ncbi:MAG TPA: class I SAM-dependent methyltransferase [Microbacterium sp.]|uniref:class I SAM-dependent methyltransferase n=1 Tax=Microbacterium sp. TaxID=51671 RepID=UPI002B4729E5|nr:class I SAM-dependent methyltransferase [Microbacterium sp.]HKT56980.1 class I SAM-dependent methyltransferase [Microbacterium sp.]
MSDAQHAGPDAATYWEERYAGAGPVWSGRVNAVLADVAATLPAGTALDLGCGEGGDAVWLAEHGWTVTGVDISSTAIARGEAAARDRGLGGDRLRFVTADLSTFDTDARFSLISACFLHSPTMLDRVAVLRRAAGFVDSGGHLLLVSHAAPPPWATQLHEHRAELLPPDEDLARLALDPALWETLICEVRQRAAVGPDGTTATLDDGVILLRRR